MSLPSAPVVPATSATARPARARRRQRRSTNTGIILGLVILFGLFLASILLPLPHNPLKPDPTAVLQTPSGTHLFGTDSLGFDVFSRTIASAQRDLPLALIGTLISALIGVPLGLFASTGKLGEGAMRVVDAFAALPMLIVAIVAVQLLGGGMANVIIAIALVNIPRFMRIVRGEALVVRNSRYVEAAVAIGCSPVRVGLNHVFRNTYGIVLVQVSLTMASSVLMVATMSFLGIGVEPPTPTWGGMIQDGTTAAIQGNWWIVLFPAAAIFLVVSALNVIADGVERRFEEGTS